MEPGKQVGKRRRRRKKHGTSSHDASPGRGRLFPVDGAAGAAVVEPIRDTWKLDGHGSSRLHMACLYGELAKVQLLLELDSEWVNNRDIHGQRPLHMVLSSCCSNADACLRVLLEHGADVNATTNLGQTPLHQAASKDHLHRVKVLVKGGADVLAKDNMGLTPLDIARVWRHRKVARYLKYCMWQVEKKKELDERMSLQALYTDLVDLAKDGQQNRKALVEEKVTEWTHKKGLPPLKGVTPRLNVSHYHNQCLLPVEAHQTTRWSQHQPGDPLQACKQPLILLGFRETLAEPDLRQSVTMLRNTNKELQLTSSWDPTPRPAPNLPQDFLQRALFPKDFPPRMASLPRDIQQVQHRRRPQGWSTSPWTEVAMHLAERLQPGHY